MTRKGEKLIECLNGTKKLSSIQEVGSVNSMIYRSSVMNQRRQEFFEDLGKCPKGDFSVFRKYLPLRFYVKNILGRMGLFNFVKRLIG